VPERDKQGRRQGVRSQQHVPVAIGVEGSIIGSQVAAVRERELPDTRHALADRMQHGNDLILLALGVMRCDVPGTQPVRLKGCNGAA
jgi:hypothetical protein